MQWKQHFCRVIKNKTMKKLILAASAAVLLSGMLNAQKPNLTAVAMATSQPAKTAVCTWEKITHNFGGIVQGKPVSVVFTFTNTGNSPLIIASVNPSCGCTTEDFSKESIAPGKKGFVKLTYNAAAVGSFTKTTTVTTNSEPNNFTLTFKGEVLAAAAPEETK